MSNRLQIPSRWPVTIDNATLVRHWSILPVDTITDIEETVAGRLVTRRVQGKITFGDLSSFQSGAVQIVTQRETCPEFDLWKTEAMRIGNILGVKGVVGTTKSGQVSVFVRDWNILAYCVTDFPTGPILDPEKRVRNRVKTMLSELPSAKDTLEEARR